MCYILLFRLGHLRGFGGFTVVSVVANGCHRPLFFFTAFGRLLAILNVGARQIRPATQTNMAKLVGLSGDFVKKRR